jgi:hypothetical protein
MPYFSDKSSLGAYYEAMDAGSYAQSRRADLPSYGDDDFGIIVHRRITQEFVIGRKMAIFDPSELPNSCVKMSGY